MLTPMVTAAVIEYEVEEEVLPVGAGGHPGDALAPVLRSWNQRPRTAPSLVSRPRLVQTLSDVAGPPVAVLVAPAGYGKTTLLAEWSDRDERPFAWVALDERDNDPRRLLASVRRAIAAATGQDSAHAPFVLVLDDVQALHHRLALAALAAIVSDLPPHAMLALASRTQPHLPIARMRAQRCVSELGPRELAMTKAEAAALMKAEGHDIGRDGVALLAARTEGWPAALSLASVFLADRGPAALERFGGADRLVAQYVRDEVLADLPPAQLEFMLRTSIVDTLTAPLCDTLTGGEDSASTLAALAHGGLLVPLDRSDERFRHLRLLSESLRAELCSTSPRRETELHRLACTWHRGAGDLDRAIDHALRAGDVAAAGNLVWENLAPLVAAGRTSTAERWLSRFMQSEIAEHPKLALTAAGCAMLRGQGQMAAHWTAAAAVANGHDPVFRMGVELLRSALAGSGAAPVRDAERSGGAVQALCQLITGSGRHLGGDPQGAAKALEAGARCAAVSAPTIQALCLAELAVLAIDEDDWELAASRVTRARAQVDRHGLADHAAMALVFAVSALVRAHRGRVDAAQSDLNDAARLQSLFMDFPPAAEAEVALLLARTALRLGDVKLGREQLTRANRLLRRVPDAVALERLAGAASAQLDAFLTAGDSAVHAPMTAAELRILQYLPTHLSFREIGELTYVSANTVKTQANAVYRKFGVSSRSEAVTHARDCGLLDGA
jgi:LuxR family maltose regulon positive regulatory protein